MVANAFLLWMSWPGLIGTLPMVSASHGLNLSQVQPEGSQVHLAALLKRNLSKYISSLGEKQP